MDPDLIPDPIPGWNSPQLFWPQNGPVFRKYHLRGQKSLGPLKNFVPGPFEIATAPAPEPEPAPAPV